MHDKSGTLQHSKLPHVRLLLELLRAHAPPLPTALPRRPARPPPAHRPPPPYMDVAAGQYACDLSEGAAAGQYACDISEGCGGRSVCIRGMPLAACGVVRRTLGLALGLLLCEVVLDDGHHRALLARLVLEDPRLPLLGGEAEVEAVVEIDAERLGHHVRDEHRQAVQRDKLVLGGECLDEAGEDLPTDVQLTRDMSWVKIKVRVGVRDRD